MVRWPCPLSLWALAHVILCPQSPSASPLRGPCLAFETNLGPRSLGLPRQAESALSVLCGFCPWTRCPGMTGLGQRLGQTERTDCQSDEPAPGLTLHVDDQQRVADGEWGPEAHGLRGAQEVLVDEGHGRQVAHGKGHGQGPAHQLGKAVSPGQQAQADPAVMLATVQLIEAADVAEEAPGAPAEQRGQPEAQQQVEGAVPGALLQEAQAAGQAAAQRVLAQQVQLQPLRAPGALLRGDRGRVAGRCKGSPLWEARAPRDLGTLPKERALV